MTNEDFQTWVRREEWYQTIELSGGVTTKGSVDSRKRYPALERIDVRGKRVLDIGCNSGAYSLWAKRHGAREVIGIDIQDKRLEQARQLARHEGLDITFANRSLYDVGALGRFDVVFCFAVLTENPDLFGALKAITSVVGDKLLLELHLAKPIAYVSKSKNYRIGYASMPRWKAVLEPRKAKHGWMIDPSLEVLRTVVGDEFRVEDRGPSVRYDLVEITRVA
ncbi:MAG TPA: class I SAM-dependent methyltransferase [Kofleriaceae bacterium]|nr:class I SAM-dependent methyltransferase [Kofleriaceae bacterium]